MEDRLPPGGAAGLGPDRRDDVDQLGQAGDRDPVGVPQQRDQQAADDDRVRRRCTASSIIRGAVLQPRSLGPSNASTGTRRSTRRRTVDPLGPAQPGADVVGGGDDAVDEGVHVDRPRPGSCRASPSWSVVGVQRDVVDLVVACARARSASQPPKVGIAAVGAAAGDQLDATGRPASSPWPVSAARRPYSVGGLVARSARGRPSRCPGTTAGCRAARRAPLAMRRSDSAVPPGWLQYSSRSHGLLDAAGAEVDRHHRLDAGPLGPGHELVRAERRWSRSDCQARSRRAGRRRRADAVLPAVAGDEVAAGVADDGRRPARGSGRGRRARRPCSSAAGGRARRCRCRRSGPCARRTSRTARRSHRRRRGRPGRGRAWPVVGGAVI